MRERRTDTRNAETKENDNTAPLAGGLSFDTKNNNMNKHCCEQITSVPVTFKNSLLYTEFYYMMIHYFTMAYDDRQK